MKRLVLILILFFSVLCVKAQHDNLYSQYMFNGLLINPAYAGSNEVLSAAALNRNQWVGFDGAPKTSTFSLHTPLKNKKVNVGITFTNDRYGITTQNKISAVYAYRIFFKKSSLSFGLQGGIDLIKNNYNAIQTTTPGDAVFTGQFSQQNIPQFGFGIYYKMQKFYIGVSSPDLLAISTSTSTYKSIFLTAGYLINVSKDVKIKPSVLVKYIKDSPVALDINTFVYFRMVGLGYSYRINNAQVAMFSLQINTQFSAGYAYDYTTSKLNTYVRGTHEIMLKYEFSYKVNPQSPRYF